MAAFIPTPHTSNIVSSNQCYNAKSPESSDGFQYDNSTCVVRLITESENGNEDENENEDSLAERLILMYLHILLPIAVILILSFSLYFVAINCLTLGETIAMIVLKG